jgi:hypothetical protein
MSKKTLYEIREFIGSSDSKPLGKHLRTYRRAAKIARRLRKQGREIILAGMVVNLNPDEQMYYKYNIRSWIDFFVVSDK